MSESAFSRRHLALFGVGAGMYAVAGAPTAASAQTSTPLPWFDVREDWGGPGAVGDNVADDTDAIQRAVDAAAATQWGGVVLAPTGRYRISDNIVFPANRMVDLIGAGRQQTRFVCTSPSAGLRFGNLGGTGGSQGSTTGGFWVDGNNVATVAMNVSESNNRRFVDIAVSRAAIGLLVEGAQNAHFDKIVGSECDESILVLDWGAGGNVFTATQLWSNSPSATNIVFRNSWDGGSPGPNNYGGRPSANTFVGAVIEGPVDSVKIDHAAGMRNAFISSGFAGPDGVKIRYRHQQPGAGLWGSHELNISGCWLINGVGIDHTAVNSVIHVLNCRFHSSQTAFVLGDRCWVNLDTYNEVGVVNRFQHAPGSTDPEDTLIRTEASHPYSITMPDGETEALRTWVGSYWRSRDTNPRYVLRASGEMGWGSGTGSPDVTLQRHSANNLQVNGALLATEGLGVGNSQIASTPGQVVRRVQVFDENGNPLGFVPVYDAID
jgi:hypothetical protein